MSEVHRLPANLPVPRDDGAADHLAGALVPSTELPSTAGGSIDLRGVALGLAVVYVYPRTGKPGEPLPVGWDDIPGARGCTLQNCSFRDHAKELAARGAAVLGVSAQPVEEQWEFARRERITYPLLSDTGLALAEALRLPTFQVTGMRLYRRLTFIARAGRIVKVFYPVFPPQQNVLDVLAWLTAQVSSR
jgi:peroxiredoxin